MATSFTILAMKIYIRSTYKQITDLLSYLIESKMYLHMKRYQIHKTPKILPKTTNNNISRINEINTLNLQIKDKIITLDGNRITNTTQTNIMQL